MILDPEILPPSGNQMLGACWDAAVAASLDVLGGDELGDLTRFQGYPLEFCREILGVRLWKKQQEIICDLDEYDRVTVRAARGVGKCVEENERIILADGRVVPARDLVGRFFSVVAFEKDGRQVPRLAWAADNGSQPVYEILTNRGRRIVRTGNHPLIAAHLRRHPPKAGKIIPELLGWTPCCKIQPGQAVLVPTEINIDGKRPIPDSHVKLLGYLLGDGATTRGIEFDQQDGPPKDEFCQIAEELGGRASRYDSLRVRITSPKAGVRTRGFVCEGQNPVMNLCREWGIVGKKSKEKRFPDFVWELPNRQIALLLNRLFACDGYVFFDSPKGDRTRTHVAISLASEGMIRDIEIALLRLGIAPSHIRQRKVASDGGEKRFTCWELTINFGDQVKRFAEVVGILGKEEKLSSAVERASRKNVLVTLQWPWRNCPKGYQWERVKSVTLIGERPTVAIQVNRSKTFLTTFVEHNTRVEAVSLTYLLLCYPQTVIVNTAPTHDQIKHLLWKEIHDLYAQAPVKLPGTLLETSWEIGPKWFAIGRSTNRPERFAGFHATPILSWQWELTDEEFWKHLPEIGKEEGGIMAVFYDEASGIPDAIREIAAGYGTTRRFKEFAASNPTQASGWFFESHQDPKAPPPGQPTADDHKTAVEWRRHHISAWDVLAHAPRLYSENYIARARVDWGSGSPMWQVHVEGEFPTEGDDTLFPVAAMLACADRRHDWVGQPLKGMERSQQGALMTQAEFGIDLGAGGSGETVVYVGRGDFIECSYAWRTPNPLVTEETIYTLAARHKPARAKIDIGSIGKSVASHLRIGAPTKQNGPSHPPLAIVEVDWGSAASNPKRFRRKRDEDFWELSQRIKQGRLSGLKDERTKGQLQQIHWHEDAISQKICVETNDELGKRNIPSPDRGAALAILFSTGTGGAVTHRVVSAPVATERW